MSNEVAECKVKEEFILPPPEVKKVENVDGKVEKPDGKKKRGRNKKRPPPMKFQRCDRLCPPFIDVSPTRDPYPECTFPNCKFLHDAKAFVEAKAEDLSTECYAYRTFGRCRNGVVCRFAKSHIFLDDKGFYRNKINPDVEPSPQQEFNHLKKDLQADLRRKNYDFKLSDSIIDGEFKAREARESAEQKNGETEAKKPKLDEPEVIRVENDNENHYKEPKKAIDWKDKLYLAPLTTVGNLPFRRICKRFGADITCGEMAMGLPLLQGHTPEWALVQKHVSEDVFGIQVCGSSPHQMGRVAQLVRDGHIDVDFVDINLGCPIDLVFNKGMGSGLMPRKKPLEVMVRAMSRILDVPLTLKMRTGIYADKRIAHTLIPKALTEWGASMVTLHGRSREQRYHRLADWSYVGECAETTTLPVYGNGDIVNFEDYNAYRKLAPRVSGVMIARGALIKPWVFTEIKEQRHWDISAPERLDIIKDFANYGLEHWGSDDKGVETTRRFLLEWLSFLHRYVPVGILQQPPQRMNERAPQYFKCRGDLETMLASPHCDDWIKISEMFLGKVPDEFAFEPKHKAHGYKQSS